MLVSILFLLKLSLNSLYDFSSFPKSQSLHSNFDFILENDLLSIAAS